MGVGHLYQKINFSVSFKDHDDNMKAEKYLLVIRYVTETNINELTQIFFQGK